MIEAPKAVYLYVVYFGYEPTVIDSQVFVPVGKLRRRGFDVRLIFFEKPWDWMSRFFGPKTGGFHRAARDLPTVAFPRSPRNFFWWNTLLLLFAAWFWRLRRRRVVFHARGLQGASVCGWIKRLAGAKVICDARGAEAEEYVFVSKRRGRFGPLQRWWAGRLERTEADAVRRADVVFSVSEALEEKLKEKWPAQRNWARVSCAVDVNRFLAARPGRDAVRAEHGLTDRLVVAAVMGGAEWQNVPAVIEAFTGMKRADAGAFLLAITPLPGRVSEAIRAAKLSDRDARAISVSFEDMPAYLAASDVGVLIREIHPLNYVAFPTKFAEYLAGGLHVVANEAVHAIATILQRTKAGTVVPFGASTDESAQLFSAAVGAARQTKARISVSTEIARARLDWEAFIPVIDAWYRRLGEAA